MSQDYSKMSVEELRKISDAGEKALLELNRRWAKESADVEARAKVASPPFTEAELRFAKFAVCECGAKLAYPQGMGPHGWWDCSAILMGKAASKAGLVVMHSDRKPFAFWKVD